VANVAAATVAATNVAAIAATTANLAAAASLATNVAPANATAANVTAAACCRHVQYVALLLQHNATNATLQRLQTLTWRNRRLPSPTRINLEEPYVTQPNQD
jgi:hypothetical protein